MSTHNAGGVKILTVADLLVVSLLYEGPVLGQTFNKICILIGRPQSGPASAFGQFG